MKKTNTPNTNRTGSTSVTATTPYTNIDKNIYFDGTSYRVRVTKNGQKFSKNFDSRNKAVRYRNQVVKGTVTA